MKKQIKLHFGVFHESISAQLKKQGFKFNNTIFYVFQQQAERINHLLMSDIMTNSEALKCRMRLLKKVTKHIEIKNKK